MALYVFISPRCEETARRFNVFDAVQKLKARVERDQRAASFEPFHGSPYVVKKKVGVYKGRLIAEGRKVDDENEVFVFHELMMRSALEYDKFRKNPGGYNSPYWLSVKDSTLAEEVRRRTQSEPLERAPEPSDTEHHFIYAVPTREESSDLIIYETREWKEAVGIEKISCNLNAIAASLLGVDELPDGFHSVEAKGLQGWSIELFREKNKVLLIIPRTDNPNEPPAEKILEIYHKKIEEGGRDRIIRLARRAYPDSTFADEETFARIERETVANMALSPEESEVLQSARAADGFPLFINGRAGSGKSTILLYLFADIIIRYLKAMETGTSPMNPPVYLTASGELLRVARETTKAMLKNELSLMREKKTLGALDEKAELFDNIFREFQPFLLERTPPQRFPLGRHVDYGAFQKFWREQFGIDPHMKSLGPDICWHIIRSYVKGMISEFGADTDSDVYLKPEDYAELPDNQKTVSQKTYEEVFSKVYERRYRPWLEKEGRWDDQDLAKYILDNDLATASYPAIFCDEAQDFTRIEMELLLRMNLFSARSVPAYDISKIPFAFAGDPFQTLNPTGFRWDAIKAFFVENFILALDPAHRARTDLNYRELSYNYRSTPPIVRFTNTVQAFRSVRFDLSEIKPQIPWAPFAGALPVIGFDAHNKDFWKRFDEIRTFVVIVPCNEGEEAEFVARDPILKKHIIVGEDKIPHNVLSAVRAKGREYPSVIVYGFGKKSREFQNLGGADAGEVETGDATLPMQYFINRLYVAVSRPKQQLIIVDSEEDKKELWQFATEANTWKIARETGRFLDPDDPAFTLLEPLREGNIREISRESAGDALENARMFAADGRERKDAYLLRQAMHTYLNEERPEEARECLARALEIEDRRFEAGENFEHLKLWRDAVRCYWLSGREGWEKLLALANKNPTIKTENTREFSWCSMLRNGISAKVLQPLLDALLRDMDSKKEIAVEVANEPVWKEVFETALAFAFAPTQTVETKRALALALNEFRKRGVRMEPAKLADLFYQAEDYATAIALWNEANAPQGADYIRATAETTPFPECLAHWERVENSSGKILEIINAKGTPETLPASVAPIAARAFLAERKFEKALSFSWKSRNAGITQSIVPQAARAGQPDTARRALQCSLLLWVENEMWDAVCEFAGYPASANTAATSAVESIRAFARENKLLATATLVRALARSEPLTTLNPKWQDPIRKYLRETFQFGASNLWWYPEISVEDAGAALERAGRISDTILFYTNISTDKHFGDSEKLFAKKRWYLCKKKLSDYEKTVSLGAKNATYADTRKSKRIEQEITEAIRRDNTTGIKVLADILKLPPFPILPKTGFPTGRLEVQLETVPSKGRRPTAGEPFETENKTENKKPPVAGKPDFRPPKPSEFSLKDVGTLKRDKIVCEEDLARLTRDLEKMRRKLKNADNLRQKKRHEMEIEMLEKDRRDVERKIAEMDLYIKAADNPKKPAPVAATSNPFAIPPPSIPQALPVVAPTQKPAQKPVSTSSPSSPATQTIQSSAHNPGKLESPATGNDAALPEPTPPNLLPETVEGSIGKISILLDRKTGRCVLKRGTEMATFFPSMERIFGHGNWRSHPDGLWTSDEWDASIRKDKDTIAITAMKDGLLFCIANAIPETNPLPHQAT
ncbi:MAG: hypothetical protein LBR07_02680 [Puniceicoccales bacterium]|nr:hypothetical protein [Puniceicoccales bacterium]